MTQFSFKYNRLHSYFSVSFPLVLTKSAGFEGGLGAMYQLGFPCTK
jgi:hypothetical protein